MASNVNSNNTISESPIKNDIDIEDQMMIDSIINKNINNKSTPFSTTTVPLSNNPKDRKISIDCEIKTENNNSLIVEIDDPDYLYYDPLELNGILEFEIKEDFAKQI